MNCPKCESPMQHTDTLQNRSFVTGKKGPATYEYHCAGCDVTDWTDDEPDGAPWCHICGAVDIDQCDCPGYAVNH